MDGLPRPPASPDAKAIAGTLDLLPVTMNVPMDRNARHGTLATKGRMRVAGTVLKPIPAPALALIGRQPEVSGSTVDIARMPGVAARHDIRPQLERFRCRRSTRR